MKRLATLLLVLSLPPASGCAVIAQMFFDAVLPKQGTSREPGISKKERQARLEEERLEDLQRAEEQREWERVRKQNATMPPWRKTMEDALGEY